MSDHWTRRGLLVAASAGFLGLAGCTDDGEQAGGGAGTDGTAGDASTEIDADDDSSDEASGEGEPAPADDLDLREANVTDVQVESVGDGEYRFDVTLYHDDSGEDGYANWWQVETREGSRLGRRELSHAHGTEPFTRSTTVVVPDGVDCVAVRGHDQTHGYGGQAALASVDDGGTAYRNQGTEAASFADADCP